MPLGAPISDALGRTQRGQRSAREHQQTRLREEKEGGGLPPESRRGMPPAGGDESRVQSVCTSTHAAGRHPVFRHISESQEPLILVLSSYVLTIISTKLRYGVSVRTELFSTEAACMPWSAASAHRLQLHSSNYARGHYR